MRHRLLSAGVVVRRATDDGWRYLILRAYNYWDFPKGEVSPDELPLETARREVGEETGIIDLDFRWGESYHETAPYGSRKKVARYYVAATTTSDVTLSVSPELGRPEHHEYRWCTFEEATRLLVDRVATTLRWAAELTSE